MPIILNLNESKGIFVGLCIDFCWKESNFYPIIEENCEQKERKINELTMDNKACKNISKSRPF